MWYWQGSGRVAARWWSLICFEYNNFVSVTHVLCHVDLYKTLTTKQHFFSIFFLSRLLFFLMYLLFEALNTFFIIPFKMTSTPFLTRLLFLGASVSYDVHQNGISKSPSKFCGSNHLCYPMRGTTLWACANHLRGPSV